jgi:7-cyano-7-deazaguanine synthase
MTKAIVLLSGGQDSTTCLYAAIRRWGKAEVKALSIFYGQKHCCEIEASWKVAEMADVERELLLLPDGVLQSSSPLVNKSVDVVQYASAEVLPGGIEATFIPMRNLLFLTLAANRAYHHGARILVVGVSQEDFGGYPDCREQFLISANKTIHHAAGESELAIWAPVLFLSKKKTVELAAALPECMEALAYSHTCYNGVFPPCGHCHACLLRAKGFAEAGIVDPLVARAKGL